MPDGVPAASRVVISCTDPRFVQVGTKQQYALRLKLAETATLVGGITDADNHSVTPVSSGLFVYGSRQSAVATIDSGSGVITTHSIGGVELTVRYPKGQVNSNFAGATSVIDSGFIEAVVQVTVTP